jgi:uncharacterized protein
MGNTLVHSELQTSDQSASRAFYSQLFDWKFEDMPMGDSTYGMVFLGDDEVNIGLTDTSCPEGTTFWINYILVENIEVDKKKAQSLGAQCVQDVTDVPGRGKFCFLLDPQGAKLALWQKTS